MHASLQYSQELAVFARQTHIVILPTCNEYVVLQVLLLLKKAVFYCKLVRTWQELVIVRL